MVKSRVKNKIYKVIEPTADLLDNPVNGSKISRRDSQLLFGEGFKIESRHKLWLYGTSAVDGYKGYIHQSALTLQKGKPTYAVQILMTQVYPEANFKTRPVKTLSFMARVHVKFSSSKNGFLKTEYGWVYKDHLVKISELKKNRDIVQSALKFLGCPYLYGGRSAQGIDCSGLAQLALLSCGIPCPRDSDQQLNVGRSIPLSQLCRGDLVFFKGHVGIMIDEKNILNATARTMDVRIEQLSKVSKIYNGIIAARRI